MPLKSNTFLDKIITVEKKFHERVLYYLVNTPVTQDDPYYELSAASWQTWCS